MEQLLEEILERVKNLENQTSEKLWTSSDIANYLQLSKGSVESRVLYKPGFPKAMSFGESKQRTRRWSSWAVKEWAAKQISPG